MVSCLACLFACCLLVWLLYISIDWLLGPTGWNILPSTLWVPSVWDLFKILSKWTSRTEDPRASKMTSKAPKTIANSWKIQPKDLRILFLMLFCRSSFLNDSTTNLMVFQVLEVPWKTTNPPELLPIITLKLCIDKTPSKVRFVSKNDVVCPLKLDPKSLKIELGTAMRSPWGTFRATASF